MCGITGVYVRGGGPVDRDVLGRMNQTLVHRGPDDAGLWTGGGIGLAMRRLSIVDVAGGHQPIANEAGDCHIVFNGEIYNHRALRARLERAGHRFRTQSDTEAILHLYEEDGVAGIARLDGMFAIAIADLRRGPGRARLVLARDRLGKKPLFYSELGDTLVFGSELKALLAHGGVPRDLDLESLHHYLAMLVVPAPRSIFRAVRKVPAGATLTCDEGGVRLAAYWQAAPAAAEDAGARDTGDLVADVRRLLYEAVEKRLDLEVPFGAFLSGGLDSGAVVGMMSRLLGTPVRTYSMGFEGPASHDELPGAALTAKYYGTEHHELRARPDVVALVHELVEHADEPLAVSSAIPLLLLSRAARKDVKVVLTGDGGDEVFAGYDRYRFERWAAMLRRAPAAGTGLVARALGTAARAAGGPGAAGRGARVGRTLDRAARFLRNARRPTGDRRLGWASGFDPADLPALLADPAAAAAHPPTGRFIEARLAAFAGRPPDEQLNAADLLLWLPDEMLAKVDRATMAASVEARAPLLDDALVDRLLRVPMAQKVELRPGRPTKPLLRRALADLLPPHLLAGTKWGFNVPLDAWFRGAAAGFLADSLSPERVRRRGLFDPAAVAALVAAHQAGTTNAGNRLFALLVLETWAARYLD